VLVGTHVGAGRSARAKQIAWAGAALASSISLVIGATVALVPQACVSSSARTRTCCDSGSRYLRTVAPFYLFLAAPWRCISRRRAAGRVLLPVLAGTRALAIVIVGGALAVPCREFFTAIAAGLAVFGALTMLIVFRARWD